MSARDSATANYVANNGGERWEIPGDEAFEAGWDAGVKAVIQRFREEYPDTLNAQWSDGIDLIASEFGVDGD